MTAILPNTQPAEHPAWVRVLRGNLGGEGRWGAQCGDRRCSDRSDGRRKGVAMRVLLIDQPANGADTTDPATELVDFGHEVVRCFDEGHSELCRGMPGGFGCPADEGEVDVAVAVQLIDGSPLQVDGVRCVVRHFIPLVTAGSGEADHSGLGDLIPVIHSGDAVSLGDAVETAAAIPLAHHGEVASVEFRSLLGRYGIDAPGACVEVRRETGGSLRVVLRPGTKLEASVAQAAAVRVAAALRALDTKASGVGVLLDDHH